MARVFLIKKPMKVLYSVEQSVGQGCANRRDDVYLVQFFLRAAMEPSPETGTGFIPPGQQPIAIDGSFGPQTNAYIRFFEQEVVRLNPATHLSQDGRIDPVPPNSGGYSATSGNIYKIYALNLAYFRRRGLQRHSEIGSDPLYPIALNPSLYV